ncbi:hypothetical protein RchiOBHm_Chr2g0111541 [Rosa chinensis]|uniref:Uncharacterized protein n=1 Tax=Rosa chinensis TaxID=74649 RepID=A0A2P6RQ05_ROSCH|nr:hypothetical protein RchiOBHm_Chr2g0111541 [Rosa chinensis]
MEFWLEMYVCPLCLLSMLLYIEVDLLGDQADVKSFHRTQIACFNLIRTPNAYILKAHVIN